MILKIYKDDQPDELQVLRSKAQEITEITPQIKQLAQDMAQTMYAAHGVGLAAIQVGKNLAMFVYDVSRDRKNWQAIINPVITKKSSQMCLGNEACLSVPSYEAQVMRHQEVVLEGLDLNGKKIRIAAQGLMARVFQHETDHLSGQLYTDVAIPGTKKPAENFDV